MKLLMMFIALTFFVGEVSGLQEHPELELKAEHQQEIKPWMPMEVELTIVNRSELILSMDPPEFVWVYIELEKKDGTVIYEGFSRGRPSDDVSTPGHVVRMIRSIPTIEISPGSQEKFTVYLKSRWGGNEWDEKPRELKKFDRKTQEFAGPLFHNPGLYRMTLEYWVRYSDPDGNRGLERILLQTDKLDVHVLEIEGHLDAFDAIKSFSEPGLILEPSHFLMGRDNQIRLLRKWDHELKSFLQKHGDSPWVPLAWYVRAYIANIRSLMREKVTHSDLSSRWVYHTEQGVVNRMVHPFMRRRYHRDALEFAERAELTAKIHDISYIRKKTQELLEDLQSREDEFFDWWGLSWLPIAGGICITVLLIFWVKIRRGKNYQTT